MIFGFELKKFFLPALIFMSDKKAELIECFTQKLKIKFSELVLDILKKQNLLNIFNLMLGYFKIDKILSQEELFTLANYVNVSFDDAALCFIVGFTVDDFFGVPAEKLIRGVEYGTLGIDPRWAFRALEKVLNDQMEELWDQTVMEVENS